MRAACPDRRLPGGRASPARQAAVPEQPFPRMSGVSRPTPGLTRWPDGSAAPAPADDIRVYQPSTRPGAPLPHAWVEDEDGHRRPVRDLLAPGRFLLIAGEDGHAWCQAASQLAAEAGIPPGAVRIGHLDGDLYDPRCTWLRHRQIAGDGAVLVRPDRFIASRHPAGASDPRAVLAAALSQIPARPAGQVARPARPRPRPRPPPSGPRAGVPHHRPARPWRWPRPAP